MEKTDIGPLLARSANARDTGTPASSSTSVTNTTNSARDAFVSSRFEKLLFKMLFNDL